MSKISILYDIPWTYTLPPQTYTYLTWIYIILPWIYILHVQVIPYCTAATVVFCLDVSDDNNNDNLFVTKLLEDKSWGPPRQSCWTDQQAEAGVNYIFSLFDYLHNMAIWDIGQGKYDIYSD